MGGWVRGGSRRMGRGGSRMIKVVACTCVINIV